MRYEELAQLIDKLHQSSVAYLEVTSEHERIVLAKEVPQPTAIQASTEVSDVSTITQPTSAVAQAVTEPAASQSAVETPVAAEPVGRVINSPMVGVVYLQPNPEAEVYVSVGDSVKKGDVLCLIEAMKLMNEITAPQDGVVSEILVTNEMVVEYNQPLIRIQS